MRHNTRQNSRIVVLGATPVELLGPGTKRKAFLISPIAGGPGSAQPIVAQVFGAGANQKWVVPAGVTEVIDGYFWGAGGNAGADGATLGGGGGGGGAFCTLGPVTVTPGQTWTISVDAAGGGADTVVTNPAAVGVIQANSGANAAADGSGGKGSAVTGVVKEAGGNGAAATGLAGAGAGGGGAGGNAASGSAGAGQVGGAGGGVATLLGNGQGGTGGAGGNAAAAGGVGGAPGAGGGGSGATAGLTTAGASGLGIIFYVPSANIQAISVSQNQNVTVGLGSMNYLPGQTFPTLVDDSQVGSVINEPWYAVSGLEGTKCKVTEILYDCDPRDLGAWIKALAGW
jgi:hypothetical protein